MKMNTKYVPFLKWWLLFTVVCVAAIFVQYAGFYTVLWEKDSSYLSWAILGIFAFFSLLCGGHIFRVCASPPKDRESFEDRLRQEEVGWFFSEFCLTLGMIGTIVGFVFMLSGFEGIDMTKPQTVQSLLSDLGKSMATALYTTLVGLVCGALLKIQYFILSLELQRIGKPKKKQNTLVSSSSPLAENPQKTEAQVFEETLLGEEEELMIFAEEVDAQGKTRPPLRVCCTEDVEEKPVVMRTQNEN
jgi:hypothetical protein